MHLRRNSITRKTMSASQDLHVQHIDNKNDDGEGDFDANDHHVHPSDAAMAGTKLLLTNNN